MQIMPGANPNNENAAADSMIMTMTMMLTVLLLLPIMITVVVMLVIIMIYFQMPSETPWITDNMIPGGFITASLALSDWGNAGPILNSNADNYISMTG